MAPQQRIKVANEKASKNITLRGNVPKSTVSTIEHYSIWNYKLKNFTPSSCFGQKLCENLIN